MQTAVTTPSLFLRDLQFKIHTINFCYNKYKLLFCHRTLTNNRKINLSEFRYFVTRSKFNNIFKLLFCIISDKKHCNLCPAISTRCQQGEKISRRRLLPAPIHDPLFSELTSLLSSIDCNWPNNSCAIRAIRPVSDTSAIYVRDPLVSLPPLIHASQGPPLFLPSYCLRHFLFPSRITFLTY